MKVAMFAGVMMAASVSARAAGPLTLDPFQVEPPAMRKIDPSLLSDPTADKPALFLASLGNTWELPPVNVQGQKETRGLKEEQRVGAYNQPRWTTQRRFPTARSYVIPEGAVEVEYWFRPTMKKDHTWDMRHLYELEIGLPHRVQLDLYFRTDQNSSDNIVYLGGQFEVRWAIADWGVIPGNPTIYLEYAPLEERPDRVEARLLLSDELAPRWHWAINLDWEQEIGKASAGEGEHEFETDWAISYTVIDDYLSVGLESIVNFSNVRENRSTHENTVYIGPSIQWKPIPHLSLNLAPLAGVTDDAGYARVFFNANWQF